VATPGFSYGVERRYRTFVLHYIAPRGIMFAMRRTTATNRNIAYRCTYHVVWCTKYRRKVLVPPADTRLKEIVQQVADEHACLLREMEVLQDHIHILCDADPQFGIHRLIRLMKGRSSRLLRQEFPPMRTRLPTLWTNSYFVATVGGAPLSLIKQYIEQQKRA
jgi:putative transposase